MQRNEELEPETAIKQFYEKVMEGPAITRLYRRPGRPLHIWAVFPTYVRDDLFRFFDAERELRRRLPSVEIECILEDSVSSATLETVLPADATSIGELLEDG